MISSLKLAEKEVLREASSEGVQMRGEDISLNLATGSWLGRTNSYRYNVINQIKSDRDKDVVTNPLDLIDYIAVSSPLHLFDGWTYLGQALYSQLRGLPQMAIHLGYYAELRAAMSLLAGQGIGIFRRHHFVVDGSGAVHRLPPTKSRPTHDAVWSYLEYWATLPHARALIGRVICPRSRTLTEWINEMPCTGDGRWNPVSSRLLHDFGLDLRRMADDRAIRNDASYRPSDLVMEADLTVDDAIEFLIETVSMLEPASVGGSFNSLDVYLLTHTARRVFEHVTAHNHNDRWDAFSREVQGMLDVMIEAEAERTEFMTLLTANATDHRPLALTSMAFDEVENGDPRPLLIRAALLLRIATGATREFLQAADIGPDSTKFWWGTRGRELGLWSDSVKTADVGDTWTNVAHALEEIEDRRSSGGMPVHELLIRCASSFQESTNLGRIAIMGVIL